jgi:hypothetical protein
MIEQHGQSKKLMGRSSAINTSVRLSSDAAKAVKELVAAHPVMSTTSLGKRVLFARQTSPAATEVAEAVSFGSAATGNDYCCGFGPGG